MQMLITDTWNFDYSQECVKLRPTGRHNVNSAVSGIPFKIDSCDDDDDDEHGRFCRYSRF